MRRTRGYLRVFGVIFLAGCTGWIPPVDRAIAGPKTDRFTVVGWVASKLSPEENARSASRAQRLRPMPAVGSPDMPPPSAPSLAPPPLPSSPASATVAVTAPAAAPTHPPSPSAASPRSGIGNSRPPPAAAPPPLPPASRSESRRRRENRSSTHFTGERSVAELRRRAEFLARKGLTYKFGGDHPSEGGMDCSGTMQFLLKSMGYPDIPRTSYHQYAWLKEKGTLRQIGLFRSADRATRNFKPGDLIFWGGTYNSGHKVSHVMVYLGRSRTGKHYIFGARGRRVKGLNGSGVDIFEYHPRSTGGRLIGYGRLPGLKG